MHHDRGLQAAEGRDAAIQAHAAAEAILVEMRKSLADRDRQLAIAVMALEKMFREVICSHDHNEDPTAACSHHESDEALEAIRLIAPVTNAAELAKKG